MRAGVVVVVALAAASSAHADPEADKLFQDGRALLDKKDYAGACKKFDAAYKLDPRAPGTMLNLGLCNEGLEHFAVALRWFHRAADRAGDLGMDREYVTAAQTHASDLGKKVAFIRVAIANPAAGMIVKIDGEELRKEDLDEYAVDPGPHKLFARAPGMKIVRKDFAIVETTAGQSVAFTFEPGESAIVIDRGKTRKTIAIATAIAGGVLVGVSGLYASVIVKNDYERDKTKFQTTCMSMTTMISGVDCAQLAQRLGKGAGSYQWRAAYVGTTMFGIGLAAVGIGAALYFTAPPKERREETVLVPVVSPDQLGFAAVGRF